MEDVVAQFLERLESDPADEEAFVRLQRIYMLDADWESMIALYARHAEALGEGDDDYWRRLIDRLELMTGNIGAEDGRESELSELCTRIGVLLDAHYGEQRQALQAFHRALRFRSDNEMALRNVRRLYEAEGQWQMVAGLYERQLDAAGSSAERVALLKSLAALQLTQIGDAAAATILAERALELAPGDEEARAIALAAEGGARDWETEISQLAAEADGSDGDATAAHIARARFLVHMAPADHADPTAVFAQLDELAPGNTEVCRLKVDWFRRMQSVDDLAISLELLADSTEDADERVAALRELAHIAHGDLGDDRTAASAYLRLLEEAPNDAEALGFTAARYENEGRFAELAEVYERANKARGRRSRDLGVLEKLAVLYWRNLGDMKAADRSFKRLRMLDRSNLQMLQFYVEHHRNNSDWRKLVPALQQLSDRADEPATRVEAAREIADVAEHRLDNQDRATDAWKTVLQLVPGDEEARGSLLRLFRDGGKWNALVEVLRESAEGAESPEDRVAYLREMVDVYRDRLELTSMANQTWAEILEIEPHNHEAIAALEGGFEESGRWSELVEVLARKVGATDDVEEKITLLRRQADIWDDHLDGSGSAAALEEILGYAPGDEDTIERLGELYRESGDVRNSLRIAEIEAGLQPDDERVESLRIVARRVAEELGDTPWATRTWERVSEETGAGDIEALRALETIYGSEARWQDWARVVQARVDATGVAACVPDAHELATLYMDELEQPEAARDTWRRLLDHDGGDSPAVEGLARVYAQAMDWDSLEALGAESGSWILVYEHLARSGDTEQDPELRADAFTRMARVARDELQDSARTIVAAESLVAIEADSDDTLRELSGLYREAGDPDSQARTIARLEGRVDGDEQLELRQQLAAIHEDELNNVAAGYYWAASAWELRPFDGALRSTAQRLALASDNTADWVSRMRAVAEAEDDDRVVEIFRAVARLSAGPLQDDSAAIEAYEGVRLRRTADAEALSALATLYRTHSNFPALVGVLDSQREAAGTPGDEVDALIRKGEVLSADMGNVDGAQAAWREALEVDPRSERALNSLRSSFASQGDWHSFVEMGEHQLEHAISNDERASAALVMARTWRNRLDDAPMALEWYGRVIEETGEGDAADAALQDLSEMVDEDASSEMAASLLVDAYSGRRAWDQVVEVHERRIAIDDGAAPGLLVDVARICDAELHDSAAAYARYGRLLEGHSTGPAAWDEMERLARDSEQLPDLALRWRAACDARGGELADLLPRLARVLRDDLNDVPGATVAWEGRRLLVADDPDAVVALDGLYREGGVDDRLAALLIVRAESAESDTERIQFLDDAAGLFANALDRPGDAVDAWEEVLTIDKHHAPAWDGLETVHLRTGNFEEAVSILSRRLEVTEPEPERTKIHRRRGELYIDELQDLNAAVEDFDAVLEVHPTDDAATASMQQALSVLSSREDGMEARYIVCERLRTSYTKTSNWSSLSAVMYQQIADASDLLDRSIIHSDLADIYENKLDDQRLAFGHVREAVRDAFELEPLRQRFEKMAAELGTWSEVVEHYEALAGAVEDDGDRRAVWVRTAEISRDELQEPERAIRWFTEARRIGAEPSVLPQLEALYREVEDPRGLVEILLERVERDPEAPETVQRLAEAAQRLVEELGEVSDGISTWERVRALDPGHARAIGRLNGLYRATDRWTELRALLEYRIEHPFADDELEDLYADLAQVCEVHQDDRRAAIDAWNEVLEIAIHDVEALQNLDRLYGITGEAAEQLAMIDRLRVLVDEKEALDLQARAARLCAMALSDPDSAVARVGEVLAARPASEDALALTETLLAGEDVQAKAADLLIVAYEENQSWNDLGRVLLDRADMEDDRSSRVDLLDRAAAVFSKQLADDSASLSAAVKAWITAGGPADRRPRLEELAARTEGWSEVAAAYEHGLAELEELEVPSERAALHVRLAELYDDVLGAAEDAELHYSAALEIEPSSRRPIEALLQRYDASGRSEDLRDVLRLKLDAVDVDERAGVLSRVADVEEELGNRDAAIEALRELHGLDPDDEITFGDLRRLIRETERWDDLDALLETRRAHIVDVAERSALGLSQAKSRNENLDDLAGAIDILTQVCDGEPDARGLRAALTNIESDDDELKSRIYGLRKRNLAAEGDWPALIALLGDQLPSSDVAGRLAIYDEIARIHAEETGDMYAAFEATLERARLVPSEREIWDRLVAAADNAASWPALANGFIELANMDSVEESDQVALRARAGQVVELRLGDIDRARTIFQDALDEAPANRELVRVFADLHTRQAAWEDLEDLYRNSAADAESDDEQLYFLRPLAQLYEERFADVPSAIETWELALDIAPNNERALDELERLQRGAGEWREVVDILRRRAEDASSDGVRAARLTEVAVVYLDELDDVSASLDALRDAVEVDSSCTPARLLLEKILEQTRTGQIQDEGYGIQVARLLESLLEPESDWQVLISSCQVQLGSVKDPRRRSELYVQLADLQSGPAEDQALAFETLKQGFAEFPGREDIVERLVNLADELDRRDSVVDMLSRGAVDVRDSEARVMLLNALASVAETTGNFAAARESYEQVLAEDESNTVALANLERIFEKSGDPAELIELHRHRLRVAEDPEERRDLRTRIARILMNRIGDRSGAAEAWHDVLEEAPGDSAALDALEEIYTADDHWVGLAGIIESRVEYAEDAEERLALQLKLGEVARDRLDDTERATEAFEQAARTDINSLAAHEALAGLYDRAGAWDDLLGTLDRIADATGDEQRRLNAWLRAGSILLGPLDSPTAAFDRYAKVFEADPTNHDAQLGLQALLENEDTAEFAADLLEPVFRNNGNTDALISLLSRRAEASSDSEEKGRILRSIAELAEEHQEAGATYTWYQRAFREAPGDLELLERLVALAHRTEREKSLVKLLDEVLEDESDAAIVSPVAMTLAHLHKEHFIDFENAALAYEMALDADPDNYKALAALDEVLARSGEFGRLTGVLERRIQVADADEIEGLRLRLAETLRGLTDDVEGALSIYETILEANPGCRPALDSVRGISQQPQYAAAAVELLERAHRRCDAWDELAEVLKQKVALADDPSLGAEISADLASVYLEHLEDSEAAFSAWCDVARLDPEQRGVWTKLSELATTEQRVQILESLRERQSEHISDDALRAGLMLDAARSATAHGDDAKARATLEEVVRFAADEEALEALTLLEELHTRCGDHAAMLSVLGRREELTFDPDEKLKLLARIARVAEEGAWDPARALDAWERTLEIDHACAAAFDGIERIHRAQGAWSDVLEVLERRVETQTDENDVFRTRAEIARVALEESDDLSLAIDAFERLLELAPTNVQLLTTLMELYRKQQAVDEEKDIIRRLVDLTSGAAQVRWLAGLATLSEQEFDDLDTAIDAHRRILVNEPGHRESRREMKRLLREAERWFDLIEMLQEDVAAADAEQANALRVEIARIAIDHLADETMAEQLLGQVRESEPNHRAALAASSRLFQHQGRWDESMTVLTEQLSVTEEPVERGNLLFEIGRIQQTHFNDAEGALGLYEDALELGADTPELYDALEQVYRSGARWGGVYEIMRRRVKSAEGEERRRQLLAIADLARDELKDVENEVLALRMAHDDSPNDLDVMDRLVSAGVRAGRSLEVAPLMERLLEASASGTRRRELYRYRYLEGRIALDRGDADGAIEAFSASRSLNATYVPSLLALGRLYVEAENWEDALSVLQTALLRQHDIPDAGQKAELFYRLGCVRRELGDDRKARDMFSRALKAEPEHADARIALDAL